MRLSEKNVSAEVASSRHGHSVSSSLPVTTVQDTDLETAFPEVEL
jgi:hypothetical protein